MTVVELPEDVVQWKRLGRHINHDPRSLDFKLEETNAAWDSLQWERHIPILNQGNVGSCTGNATVGALGSGNLYNALVSEKLSYDEDLALSIYSDAENVDGDGPYPPNDNGSSGLSVAKVCKTRGYISGYTHATNVNEAYTALVAGPFIIGTYWYSGMDTPDGVGQVQATGKVRGGHEYLCRGYDSKTDLWHFDNSWGDNWGQKGSFAYDTPTLELLLARNGDITSFVPTTSPAPTPTPSTTVTRTFDGEVAIRLDRWANTKHTGTNKQAATDWKTGQ